MATTSVFLLRHAEAGTNNRPEHVAGLSPESQLTDAGRAQALSVGWRLSRLGVLPQIAYVSEAVRTRQTLDLATHVQPPEQIIIDPRLNEMSQGGWEGELRDGEYSRQMRAGLRQCGLDYKARHPKGDGDSKLEVATRMCSWLSEIPEAAPGQVLAVSHRMAIGCLLAALEGWPKHLRSSDGFLKLCAQIGNASLTELAHSGGSWQIRNIGK